MPEHTPYHDDEIFNPETHHEHSDVPVRPLWVAIVVFVIFAAVSHALLWFLYKGFVAGERNRAEAPQSAVARPADASVPKNQPLLQPFPRTDTAGVAMAPNHDTPVTDMTRMRAAEEAVLNHYGWIDRQQGRAHIPIEIAKDRAVALLQTLPPAAAPASGEPVAAPGSAAAPVPPSASSSAAPTQNSGGASQ